MTVIVTRDGGDLLVKVPPRLLQRARDLPGRRYNETRQGWLVPATQEVALRVHESIVEENGAHMDPEALELVCEALDARKDISAKTRDDLPEFPGRLCECPEGPLLEDPDSPTPTLCLRCNFAVRSWNHQRQAFHFAKNRESAGLFMDMGTAKSRVLIGLAEYWQAQLVVILGPLKPIRVWHQEFPRHAVRDWIVANHGGRKRDGSMRPHPSAKQRIEVAKEALREGERTGRPVAICVNYETCWRGEMKKFLLSLDIDVAGVDEGHRIKQPSGVWSRFAAQLGKRAKRRLDLTGTPRPHSEPDLWAQARFLDPGIFGTSYRRFLDKFFRMGGYEGREVMGFKDEEAEQEFIEIFASFAYVCGEDVLDLPPQHDLPPTTTTLEPAARRHYDELEKDFVTWIAGHEDKPVEAVNALSKLIRLAQVASGHLFIDDGIDERTLVEIGTEKRQLLDEVLEDMPDEPVVVFGRFIHDLANIRKVAEERGLRYGEISGARSDGLGRSETGEELPTMNPDIDICGVQLKAGGVGIDLTRARYAIYYSMDFSLGDHLQSRKRVHRPGQTRPTIYMYLVAENTIEETIAEALRKREQVLDAVISKVKSVHA